MMADEEYNGWTNHATWNVALWIGNDEELYRLACRTYRDYERFAAMLRDDYQITETPDGIAYDDASLDTDELDEMLEELRNE